MAQRPSRKRHRLRRWVLRLLPMLAIAVVVCLWARWRPAQRFTFTPPGEHQLRVATWNVGYFAPVSNKNLRDVDVPRIAATIERMAADVVVLQELGSLEQARAIADCLGEPWRVHAVETGHHAQVMAVVSRVPVRSTEAREAGGRQLLGVSIETADGRQAFIAAVHAPHPARGMDSTVDNIRGAVAFVNERSEPIRIMTGDLNYNFDDERAPASPLYTDITEHLGDSTLALGETYYAHTRIDHAFHFPRDLPVVDCSSGLVDLPMRLAAVPGFRDHRPIVVTYDLSVMR